MLICRNAEGVHGKKKVGNPWYSITWASALDFAVSGEDMYVASCSKDLSRSLFLTRHRPCTILGKFRWHI